MFEKLIPTIEFYKSCCEKIYKEKSKSMLQNKISQQISKVGTFKLQNDESESQKGNTSGIEPTLNANMSK